MRSSHIQTHTVTTAASRPSSTHEAKGVAFESRRAWEESMGMGITGDRASSCPMPHPTLASSLSDSEGYLGLNRELHSLAP